MYNILLPNLNNIFNLQQSTYTDKFEIKTHFKSIIIIFVCLKVLGCNLFFF